jgi:uncharacterized membrane protein
MGLFNNVIYLRCSFTALQRVMGCNNCQPRAFYYNNSRAIGIILAVIEVISFVAGTLYFKRNGTEQSRVALNFWQSIIGAVTAYPPVVIVLSQKRR